MNKITMFCYQLRSITMLGWGAMTSLFPKKYKKKIQTKSSITSRSITMFGWGAMTSLFPKGFLTAASGAQILWQGKTFQCQPAINKRKKVEEFQCQL